MLEIPEIERKINSKYTKIITAANCLTIMEISKETKYINQPKHYMNPNYR